jgi:hypothetical protein
MAKDTQIEKVLVPDKALAVPDVKISISVFCARKSETVRRPELIGAFCAHSTAAGDVSDTEAGFNLKYDDFITKPA